MCCAAACADSHPDASQFGSAEGGNSDRPSGVGEAGAGGGRPIGAGDGDDAAADGGTPDPAATVDGADPGVAGEGPLTQTEILDSCSIACAHVDECGGPPLLQCVKGCISLGDVDVTPHCDEKVRTLIVCVGELDCSDLKGSEVQLERTRCAGDLEILKQDCGLG